MSETPLARVDGISRRDALRRLALALVATGTVDRLAAQDVHRVAAETRAVSGGVYTPVALTAHQYRTLERLTDLIIPVENGAPGALAAGAAAWIDTLAGASDRLKLIYSDGLAWLDAEMRRRGAADFVSASTAEQTALLDLVAYRRNRTPELEPGIEFFSWARRMTVDAFYTSEIGIKDIDYRGNAAMAEYTVPTESIEYALKRSGL
ncbi:MAG TPA: gluconate 2-dehydrogenase subunit 3 family protein [Vicinamibacterales bacterium]|nr:gluconate 2-dehydrogenase subunit 3 family protein [Vicinamibacterales bacterium]